MMSGSVWRYGGVPMMSGFVWGYVGVPRDAWFCLRWEVSPGYLDLSGSMQGTGILMMSGSV